MRPDKVKVTASRQAAGFLFIIAQSKSFVHILSKKNRPAVCRPVCVLPNPCLAQLDEPHDHGRKCHVEEKLEYEVATRETEEHILHHVVPKAKRLRPAGQRFLDKE